MGDDTTLRDAMLRAREALEDMRGEEVEGVVAAERHDDGFTIELQVVELRRVPRSTDVVGTYEVELDEDGEVTAYRRIARSTRASIGEDGL